MSIVSSTYTIDATAQASGARYVIEHHTDSTGEVHRIGPYLIPAGFDMAARLTLQADALATILADNEAQQVTV